MSHFIVKCAFIGTYCEVCFCSVLYTVLALHFKLVNVQKCGTEHSSCI